MAQPGLRLLLNTTKERRLSKPTLAVCVITRQRPEKLKRLLGELATIDRPESMNWTQTVVVDNDTARTAQPIVSQARGVPGLRYETEALPGVVHARNTAVATADCDWIAFLDDDTIPSRRWLLALCQATFSAGSDAAIGPVPIRFESDPPAGIRESGVLDFPNFVDGQSIDIVRTGNVLLRHSALPERPFPHELSGSGGEDHFLGLQMRQNGKTIVFASDAVVEEWMPSDRLTRRAIADRQRRLGLAYVKVQKLLARTGDSESGLAMGAKAVLRVLVGLAMQFPGLPRRRYWQGHKHFWYGRGQLEALAGSDSTYYGN